MRQAVLAVALTAVSGGFVGLMSCRPEGTYRAVRVPHGLPRWLRPSAGWRSRLRNAALQWYMPSPRGSTVRAICSSTQLGEDESACQPSCTRLMVWGGRAHYCSGARRLRGHEAPGRNGVLSGVEELM